MLNFRIPVLWQSTFWRSRAQSGSKGLEAMDAARTLQALRVVTRHVVNTWPDDMQQQSKREAAELSQEPEQRIDPIVDLSDPDSLKNWVRAILQRKLDR